MSAGKTCEKHRTKKLHRRICALLLAFIVAILFIILVIWLVLRPTKPRFALQDAIASQLNATSPNTLSATIQVTLSSQNPNERIGIYYDRLLVYATYRNQQITLPTELPPFYQGHKDLNVWSPILSGNWIPVSPSLVLSLEQDLSVGTLLISVKIDGRVRWKVGTWVSGRYHIYVSCPGYIVYGPDGARLQHPSGCSVDV